MLRDPPCAEGVVQDVVLYPDLMFLDLISEFQNTACQ
jgi:hypothetical protein